MKWLLCTVFAKVIIWKQKVIKELTQAVVKEMDVAGLKNYSNKERALLCLQRAMTENGKWHNRLLRRGCSLLIKTPYNTRNGRIKIKNEITGALRYKRYLPLGTILSFYIHSCSTAFKTIKISLKYWIELNFNHLRYRVHHILKDKNRSTYTITQITKEVK